MPAVDFTTTGGDTVRVVVTDLGILEPVDGELTLVAVHPGIDVAAVCDATGWGLRVARDLRETHAPTPAELTALRSLRTKGAA